MTIIALIVAFILGVWIGIRKKDLMFDSMHRQVERLNQECRERMEENLWLTKQLPVKTTEGEHPVVLESEISDEDYILTLQRPNMTVIKVLLPKEGSTASHGIEKVTEPFGLNLVSHGHYT